MTGWTLNPEYDAGQAGTAFASLDAVFALQGKQVASDPLSEVLLVEVGSRRYYVKRYHGAGKNLRRFIGRPRVQSEWRNLLLFKAWGIPVATVVGYGMERRYGSFYRGALITEELYGTEDLAKLAERGDDRLRDRQWLDHVLPQVAHATRLMHEHSFAHNDLKWRNILVDSQLPANIYLIDCPGGTYWWGPFLEYRKIKDLACLDKIGKYQLSRTRRLRFYLAYCGRDQLVPADRARIRKIVRYFEGRE